MKIERVKDGLHAERYMRGELADGTTLAHLVLERTAFSKGRFRVAIPKRLDGRQAAEFRQETFHVDGDEPIALARLIKAFIGAPGHAVMIQDTQASLSDPWLSRCEYRELAKAYDGEVYWAVEGEALARVSDEEMLSVINCASFYPFSCFFYISSSGGSEEFTASELDRVAERLVGIAVGAFDERSFLMWWRDDLVPFPL